MKQPIRYFSIGLLTASIITLLVVLFFDKSNSGANESSVEEMIAALKTEGYHVLSASDYISLTVAANSEEDDEAKEDEVDNTEKADEAVEEEISSDETEEADNTEETSAEPEVEEPEVFHYTLTIEPNTLGPTIGKLLKDNNIITDAAEFSRYLEAEGYAEYIQLGEHKVSSDMTHNQLAETIARKR
jgi:cobalamin biosynthesis protein CobT